MQLIRTATALLVKTFARCTIAENINVKALKFTIAFLISVMSNRPLRDGELFEIQIERMVERWSGSIEAGVTLIRQIFLFPRSNSNQETSFELQYAISWRIVE